MYQSRGPVKNEWGQVMGLRLFFSFKISMAHQPICKVESMGSMLFFEQDTIGSQDFFNLHRSHASINFDRSLKVRVLVHTSH